MADAEDEHFDYWWMEDCIVGGIDWDNWNVGNPVIDDFPDPEGIEISELAKKIAG